MMEKKIKKTIKLVNETHSIEIIKINRNQFEWFGVGLIDQLIHIK